MAQLERRLLKNSLTNFRSMLALQVKVQQLSTNFFVFPALVLQQTTKPCRIKESINHLKRRLDLWMKKDMQSLLNEGRCLQQPYRKSGSKKQGDFDYARHFNDLMSCGKVHEALGMLNTAPIAQLERDRYRSMIP